jgi:DNA excision repair protein ERCC-2
MSLRINSLRSEVSGNAQAACRLEGRQYIAGYIHSKLRLARVNNALLGMSPWRAESMTLPIQNNSAGSDPSAPAVYCTSVRELCSFTAKVGDLDLRFTPSPSAQEGVAGHKTVVARRPVGYLSELTLRGRFESLSIRGRADGFDPVALRLEEIKTYRGDLAAMPENYRQLHWAQAQTYAWLKCEQDQLAQMRVGLVYFSVSAKDETLIERVYHAQELRVLFESRCRRFSSWATRQQDHRCARDLALAVLAFPHGEFRAGQRVLAQAVFRAARDGKCLSVQAPTGIGKTLGTLFPALKAMGAHQLDKIFYLTAKTSGRQQTMEALGKLCTGDIAVLRVIELVARESACEHPGLECHGQSCPLAQGFYDRLESAREAALELGFLDRETLRKVASEHRVCPYYLSQELVKWCDVVVGDYNHYFDSNAMLHAMMIAHEWRAAVLVDEAHNLVERARSMYSAELSRRDVLVSCRGAAAPMKRALKRLVRSWDRLLQDQTQAYQVHEEPPQSFLRALDDAILTFSDQQSRNPELISEQLLSLYFAAAHFVRIGQDFGAHCLFDSSLDGVGLPLHAATDARLCLRNVVPARHLAPRFADARSVAIFSATLAPAQFYLSMLGLPSTTVALKVQSPFDAEQLTVRIATHISTRFADRSRSKGAIAELIGKQFDEVPGNYIAFFSSFEYLRSACATLQQKRPDIPIWAQLPRMDGAQQAQFLARFDSGGRGIGFAVLGGRFAEGVDLPGGRLIGAFIATLGLPQINPVNEQLRRTMTAQFGAGYEYTYLYPGLRKVVQAAGRVIRTTTDQGIIHLLDDRFAKPQVLDLLPKWWNTQTHLTGPLRGICRQGKTETVDVLSN